jgi:hypothetical protein
VKVAYRLVEIGNTQGAANGGYDGQMRALAGLPNEPALNWIDLQRIREDVDGIETDLFG